MSTSHAPAQGVQVPPPLFWSESDKARVNALWLSVCDSCQNAIAISKMHGINPVSALAIASFLGAAAEKLYLESRRIRVQCKRLHREPDDVVIPPEEREAILREIEDIFEAEIGGEQ